MVEKMFRKKRFSLDNERLHNKIALGAAFMFIIPVLLTLYMLFNVLFEKKEIPSYDIVKLIIFWILISGLFGYFIIRRSIVSILNIISRARDISQGKLDVKLDTPHRDELKDLAVAFNKITADLETKIKELEHSRNLTRELFQKIGNAVTASQKLESLLSLVMQSTLKAMEAEASFVAIYEGDSRWLTLKAYSGPQKDLREDMRLPDNKGVIGFVISTKKPMVIKKVGRDILGQIMPSKGEKIIYKNILCVPIIGKKALKGVIGVCDLKDTEHIESEDLFLLENIAAQIATSIENFELNKDIEDTYYETLLMLARAVEAKDRYSGQHLERVNKYVDMMAEKIGLIEEDRRVLGGGATLHDLGKVGIQDDILNKGDKLTPKEYDIMKQHTIIGENILKPLRSMSKLSELVRHHHEHYDGTGYPDGMQGENIPLLARILTLADVYDALTADRPYKKAATEGEALETLRSYAGNILDPKLVEVFIGLIKETRKK